MANRKNNSSANGKKKEVSALEKARRANAATSSSKKKEKRGAKAYWQGVKREMSKVVWPTRKELGTYTVVVVVTCAVLALGFWLIDTGVLAVLKHMLGIALS
ncbi:MAG: preprotein translocase subunit SecE [Eubacteriales bacterium]|nr:preprotein translocase subunit SecE [Eubacteriales bacterium]